MNRIQNLLEDSDDLLTNVNNISEVLVELMQYCKHKGVRFDSVLELAIDMGGYAKLKSNPFIKTAYMVSKTFCDSVGEEIYYNHTFTTRELAENFIEIERKAYTWEGECPYEFEIKETRID